MSIKTNIISIYSNMNHIPVPGPLIVLEEPSTTMGLPLGHDTAKPLRSRVMPLPSINRANPNGESSHSHTRSF